MEALDEEIFTSLEEQTQWRWGTTRLEEERGELLQVFCGPTARLNPVIGPR